MRPDGGAGAAQLQAIEMGALAGVRDRQAGEIAFVDTDQDDVDLVPVAGPRKAEVDRSIGGLAQVLVAVALVVAAQVGVADENLYPAIPVAPAITPGVELDPQRIVGAPVLRRELIYIIRRVVDAVAVAVDVPVVDVVTYGAGWVLPGIPRAASRHAVGRVQRAARIEPRFKISQER
jgi:hypothetical protein